MHTPGGRLASALLRAQILNPNPGPAAVAVLSQLQLTLTLTLTLLQLQLLSQRAASWFVAAKVVEAPEAVALLAHGVIIIEIYSPR